MRQLSGINAIAVLLFGIVVLLVALNVHVLNSTIDISPSSSPKGNPEKPALSSIDLVTPLDRKAAADFQQTVERPLFNPSRRPIKRATADAAVPNTHAGDLRLVGVMKAADQPPRALIRFANGQAGRWIAEGEEFDGWKLRKINVRSVTLESGGQSHELSIAMPRRVAEDLLIIDPGGKRR